MRITRGSEASKKKILQEKDKMRVEKAKSKALGWQTYGRSPDRIKKFRKSWKPSEQGNGIKQRAKETLP